MSLEVQHRYKIDYAASSERGTLRPQNNDSYGKFPFKTSDLSAEKGQLFVVADAKAGNPGGRDAGKMVIRIIQENYFTYPSQDITFSLLRAFDMANRRIYQYAQANGLHRKIGATCSALVLTGRYAYVAHVGDCRIYKISVRKIEQITRDHVRLVEMRPSANGRPNGNGKPLTRSVLTRALGVKLGIKVDSISKIAVHRDEYFLICSDGLNVVSDLEKKNIVLSSSPEQACRKLIDLARQRGCNDDVTVEVVKVYQEAPQYAGQMYAHVEKEPTQVQNRILYTFIILLISTLGFLIYKPFLEEFSVIAQPPEKAALVSAAPLTAAPLQPSPMNEAKELVKRGRLNQALKIYQTVLRNQPENAAALEGIKEIASIYKSWGDDAYWAENWSRARMYYRKARKLKYNRSDLSILISRCDQELTAARSEKLANHTTPAKLNIRKVVNTYNTASLADVTVNGIQRSQWRMFGLDEYEDFLLQQESLTFFDNFRVKKAFHRENYQNISVEVVGKKIAGSDKGRYGLIFGNDLESKNRYRDFYLFSVNGDGQYFLHHIMDRTVRLLSTGTTSPGYMGQENLVQLKVNYTSKYITLAANGENLNVFRLKRPRRGGVGLYSDPRIRVKFSKLKLSPIIFN